MSEISEIQEQDGWVLSPRSAEAVAIEHQLAQGDITLDAAMEMWAAAGIEVS